MPEISFDLGALFEQAFGYRTQAFEPEFKRVPSKGSGKQSPIRTIQGAHGSPYYSADAAGREYYLPVTLIYPDSSKITSQDTTGNSSEQQSVLNKWNLPYPVVSISSRKTIIETPLTERRGTVKELINIQDYEIVIKGFLIANTDEFPEDEVTMLRTVYEQNTPLSIQCPLTDIFLLRPERGGSDQVVITQLKLPVIPGVKNIRPYELRMVSDEPFSLIAVNP